MIKIILKKKKVTSGIDGKKKMMRWKEKNVQILYFQSHWIY